MQERRIKEISEKSIELEKLKVFEITLHYKTF